MWRNSSHLPADTTYPVDRIEGSAKLTAAGVISMTIAKAALDADLYSRTASIFASKRVMFDKAIVEALARDITKYLARKNSLGPTFDVPAVRKEEITAFCEALIQPNPEASLRFIESRRAEGLSRQGVYLGYITAAARCLGEAWEEDKLTFLQVTYGTGHLYALMRALRAERHPLQKHLPDERYRALFATVPGEEHGIGITVAADLFREVGWEIDLQTDTDHDALLARVEQTQPNVIGLSLSAEQRLEALVRLVVGLRIIMPYAIIGVAPAKHVDANRLHELVDIDLVFDDAPSACRELRRLIDLRE